MSFLFAMPEWVSAAATDLAGIGSTISTANVAAAVSTTGIMPAALDEVSAGVAALFGAHGQAYQAISAQATQFHEQFVQAMTATASAYANAEANVVQTLTSTIAAPAQAAAAAASGPGNLLQQLEAAEINFNTNLVNGELSLNHWLLTNEVGLEQAIFGTNSALNGVINRGFNAGNLLVGTGEQAINSLVGAPAPTSLTSSLLTGSAAQVFNSGAIGGPLGSFDQSLVVGADFAGLLLGSQPGQALLSLLPASTQAALASAPANFLKGLETAQLSFNSNLIGSEFGLNNSLLTHELGLEQAIFGTDSALNGTVNRGFNVGNLLLGTGEQAFNTLSGAQVAQPAFFQSLLTGTGQQVFNSGQIGGLVGAFDQSLAAGFDLAGLFVGS
ncbi:PE family protein [Mycobacterium heidelbergense]|uniref:Uncharacterized protein n=1 Tax=Mycobacterium heidelbergense TaxID=53376 RepID=A0A1X0DRB6_MYCHE|nr:PE family protein [Mycobacterium heidelbergense]MCV7052562.1 PE family protein [Mycobacterium heidelbergense]ORA74921.1 hypothetical protein BST25_07285 [Mycobacterium heidelbergense]BBZ51451.1 hypothetical protein MHEI_31680 [Mycobacterium heidelbergense]